MTYRNALCVLSLKELQTLKENYANQQTVLAIKNAALELASMGTCHPNVASVARDVTVKDIERFNAGIERLKALEWKPNL